MAEAEKRPTVKDVLGHTRLITWVDGMRRSLAMTRKDGTGNEKTSREMRADLQAVERLHFGDKTFHPSKKTLGRIATDLGRLP